MYAYRSDCGPSCSTLFVLFAVLLFVCFSWCGSIQAAPNKADAPALISPIHDSNHWDKFSEKENVRLKWSDGDLIVKSGQDQGRVVYQQRVPFRGARVSALIQFEPDESKKKNPDLGGGLVFFDVLTEDGQPLCVKIMPESEIFNLGSVEKSFHRLPENPYRYEIDIELGPENATLYWGGRQIASTPVQYRLDEGTLGVFASHGELAVSSLSIRGGAGQVEDPDREYQNMSLTIGDTAQPLPSPWLGYWGTHYARVEGADDPDPQFRYSTVRNYDRLHLSRDREDSSAFQGPFTDETVYIDLDDYEGRKTYRNPTPATIRELMPEVLQHDLTILNGTPGDMNLAYHLLDQIYTEWPEAKKSIVWCTGNELLSAKHYNPFNLTAEQKSAPRPEGLAPEQYSGGYDLNEKMDYYINHRLGPAALVIETISQKHYGDPHAIPIALGSLNPYKPADVWFLPEIFNRKFGEEAPEPLRGDYTWQHFSILDVHYMFDIGPGHKVGAEKLRQRMDRYVEDYLRTGKVEGIWVNEGHGRAGRGPVTILKTGFRFLDWVVANQLTSDQTKQIWWGESSRAGGSGQDMMRELGRFLVGGPLSMVVQKTDAFHLYILRDRDMASAKRILVCIVPQDNPGYLDLGTLTLSAENMPKSWQTRAVQYSAISLPEEHSATTTVEADKLQIELNHRITEPMVLWIHRADQKG